MMAQPIALPGPHDVARRVLPNGIAVLVREHWQVQSVVVNGWVEVGSLFDPAGQEGLASFVAEMLMRGTERRNFQAIHEWLESYGASLDVSAGRHSTGFAGRSLAEDLPMLIDLLADALRRPVFSAEQIERLRGQLVTAIKIREQDTEYVASRLFREMVYRNGHPYSRPVEGTVETVSHFSRDQLVEFHRAHYGPRQMAIVIVGAVATETAFRLVEEHFGDWENEHQPSPPALPAVERLATIERRKVVLPGKSQADVVLGTSGPSRFAPDWTAATLANHILGVFGMYGRIGARVREQLGMAYYSYSRLDGGPGPGPWRVVAGVNPANVAQTVSVIQDELRRITQEPVSEEELENSKSNYIGRLPLQLESNEGVAGALLNIERYQLGLDYLLRYSDEISAVTTEQVLAAARHYLDPDAFALAIAGPDHNDLST